MVATQQMTNEGIASGAAGVLEGDRLRLLLPWWAGSARSGQRSRLALTSRVGGGLIS